MIYEFPGLSNPYYLLIRNIKIKDIYHNKEAIKHQISRDLHISINKYMIYVRLYYE